MKRILFLTLFFVPFFLPLSASAATLSLSPTSNSVTNGATFTVNILLDTSGQPTYGVDVYSLHFNPAVLQVVDADGATSGVQIGAGSLMANNQYNTVNNSTGVIQFSQTPSTGSSNFTGTGTLATITFQALSAGSSNVTFDYTNGSTIDTNVASLYTDLLTGVTNGTYTVTNPVDTTPPTVSAITAGSITTSGATITWTTNENSDSQVEYGLTTAYGTATTLNSTLVTAHSVAVSGLSAGTLYHYRVKSKDAAGNLTASADQTFTTLNPAAPDTTAPTVSITSPANGATVSNTITLSVSASDPTIAGKITSGMFSTTVLIDGTIFNTTPGSAISVSLDTTTLTNAIHTITATARDNAGNIGTASSVSVTVFNLSTATRYPRKVTLSSLEGLSSIPSATGLITNVISPGTGSVLSTQTLSPDVSGVYTVPFQTSFPQTVSIRVSVAGYLARLLTNIDTTVNSVSNLVASVLFAGDFDNNNTINTLDYSLLNTHWNQNFAQTDINQDGLVNSIDFGVLKNNFNKVGE